MTMTYWMATGPGGSWEVGLQPKRKMWGMIARYEREWDQVAPGDTVLFYATSPIKGVFGYGKVRSKVKEDTPLWAQEREEGKAIWPFRLVLDVESSLPKKSWETKRIRVSPKQAVRQRGFQKLRENVAKELIHELEANL